MKHKPGYAILSAVLALTLAGMACSGGNAAPTSAPTTSAPTVAAPTQVAATEASTATAAPTPLAESTATEQSTATATKAPPSGSLDVHAVSSHLGNDMWYHVVGLVTNGTGQPATNIQLAIQVTDSAGKTVLQDDSGNPTSTVSVSTFLSTLASGESSPFDAKLNTNGNDTSGWRFDVKLLSHETPSGLQRVHIDVVNDLGTIDASGYVYLTGELVNRSDQPAQINGLAGAMLDGADRVAIASGFTAAAKLLAPAGDASGADRTPFAITIPGPTTAGAQPAYYVDGVAGDPASIATAADVHPKLVTGSVDAAGAVQVLATISNTGTNSMTVKLVAGLYDQAGRVLDVLSIDAPIYLAPGQALPVRAYSFTSGNADLMRQVVSYTAQIDPYYTHPTTTAFVALQASNVTTETSTSTARGNEVTITGEIVNTTQLSLDIPTIVVSIKDADGKLVATDVVGALGAGPILPNAKATFSLTTPLPDKIDPSTLTYETIVQANVRQ